MLCCLEPRIRTEPSLIFSSLHCFFLCLSLSHFDSFPVCICFALSLFFAVLCLSLSFSLSLSGLVLNLSLVYCFLPSFLSSAFSVTFSLSQPGEKITFLWHSVILSGNTFFASTVSCGSRNETNGFRSFIPKHQNIFQTEVRNK